MSPSRLTRGDLLPKIQTEIPGPRSRAACATLRRTEAPGINTLYRDHDTLVWDEALGANVLDLDGNRFLDFTSGFGVAALGHRHPEVVAAVAGQSERLLHGLGDVAAHPARKVDLDHAGEVELSEMRVGIRILIQRHRVDVVQVEHEVPAGRVLELEEV